LFSAAEQVFRDFRDVESAESAHVQKQTGVRPLNQRAGKFPGLTMEIDMTGKITAIVAAAIVLGSVGVASAQTHRYVPRGHWQAP
jgi:hypothetical protein